MRNVHELRNLAGVERNVKPIETHVETYSPVMPHCPVNRYGRTTTTEKRKTMSFPFIIIRNAPLPAATLSLDSVPTVTEDAFCDVRSYHQGRNGIL